MSMKKVGEREGHPEPHTICIYLLDHASTDLEFCVADCSVKSNVGRVYRHDMLTCIHTTISLRHLGDGRAAFS